MDSILATNICADLPHRHLLFVSLGDQSFPCNTDDKLSQNGCYWATVTSWYCEASFGGLLWVNIQVTPWSNYCMHARNTSPVRGTFHFDSVTPVIVKLDPLEFNKARSLTAFSFWFVFLKTARFKGILTFPCICKDWQRLDLHTVTHVLTCNLSKIISPVIFTNRVPGLADRWINFEDEVWSVKSNCQKRKKRTNPKNVRTPQTLCYCSV